MSNPSARIWLAVTGLAALSAWFGSIALFEHFDATRPFIPNPEIGRVIPQNNHGHVVYLTRNEEKQKLSLQYGTVGLAFVALVPLYFYRKTSKIQQSRVTNY